MFAGISPLVVRKVYSNLGSVNANGANALLALTKSNATSLTAFGIRVLSSHKKCSGLDVSEIDAHIDWALGYDVDNDDNDANGDTRQICDAMFLVIRFTLARWSITMVVANKSDQDVRIIRWH